MGIEKIDDIKKEDGKYIETKEYTLEELQRVRDDFQMNVERIDEEIARSVAEYTQQQDYFKDAINKIDALIKDDIIK